LNSFIGINYGPLWGQRRIFEGFCILDIDSVHTLFFYAALQ
jgi:hypothetical protein